jgi:S-adenosylmethionine-dependent methyltransferase
MTAQDKFNQNINNWIDWGNQPWADLRYNVININLQRHFPDRPLNILDAGGGDGRDAIRLARQGHQVTLVDYSDTMLKKAQQDAEESLVIDKMRFYQAPIEQLSDLFPLQTFDVVLFHNVIQYVKDATEALRLVCGMLRNDGILSVSSVNRYSEAYREALLRLNLDAAYDLLDAKQIYTATFDTMTTQYSAEEIKDMLQSMGYELTAHYGIRCVNDYIYDNNRKFEPDFYSKLERLEIAMSGKYPYYLLARFFQLIARKVQ